MNIPNILTVLRLCMIPLFVLAFGLEKDAHLWSTFVFLLASGTDVLDGYLARKLNMSTRWGQLMDPLADKVLTTAAFMALMEIDRLWLGSVAIMLILTREFLVAGLRMNAGASGTVIAASMFGKVKTVVQMIAIIASIALTHSVFPHETALLMTNIFVWVSTVVTVLSGVDYLWKNRQVFLK